MPNLPFENRWTSGETARHWYLQLEREGRESVKIRNAFRDSSNSADPDAEIPQDFIASWLAYHDRRDERRALHWRCTFAALILIAAIAASIAAWYGVSAYNITKTTEAGRLSRAVGR